MQQLESGHSVRGGAPFIPVNVAQWHMAPKKLDLPIMIYLRCRAHRTCATQPASFLFSPWLTCIGIKLFVLIDLNDCGIFYNFKCYWTEWLKLWL